MAMDGVVRPGAEAWRRISKVVRLDEGERGGRGEGERYPTAPAANVYVKPTGVPLRVSDVGPLTVRGVDVPAPSVKMVYPGKVVVRELDEAGNDKWYSVEDDDGCFVAELNNQGLWLGRHYKAGQFGELAGLGVFAVLASADPQKLLVLDDFPEVTIAGVKYWAAAVTSWNAADGVDDPSTVTDEDVLIFDRDNLGFMAGQKVWGKLVGPVVGSPLYGSAMGGASTGYGGDVWTAFQLMNAAGGGGGGGEVRILRIDGPYIQDDPLTVTPASPLRYYPATDVTDLTPAGFPTSEPRPQVWWCSWYGYGDVPPRGPGKPYTVVICDGSAAVDAVYKGFSYAPDDGSGESPSGQSRPVYASTHYARARRMRCETDEAGDGPKETLGGS